MRLFFPYKAKISSFRHISSYLTEYQEDMQNNFVIKSSWVVINVDVARVVAVISQSSFKRCYGL
jgi:hypothetical protein